MLKALLLRLRKFAFAWFCNLRGFHRASKPQRVQGATVSRERGQTPKLEGYWVRFSCVCGAEEIMHADTARGGRIVVPVTWKATK
jgi:hypothetical protein